MGTGRELWDVAGIEDGVKSGDGGRMSLAMWECGEERGKGREWGKAVCAQ